MNEHLVPAEERSPVGALRILLAFCIGATLSLGVAKLFVQRAHPPSYVFPPHNTYEGFVAIDEYCVRAERMRDWLRAGDGEARAALEANLKRGDQPTAILVPFLVGLASAPGAGPGIVPTFATFTGLVFLLQVFLVGRIARALARGLPPPGAGPAAGLPVGVRPAAGLAPAVPPVAGIIGAILLAAHCDSARSAAQLFIDPHAAAATSLAILLCIVRMEKRGRGNALALLVTQTLGCFVKLSYMPVLAAPALFTFLAGGRGRWRRASIDAVLFGVLPAIPSVLYLVVVPTLTAFSAEMDQAAASSSLTRRELWNFALEMALLVQLFPFLLIAARRGWGPGRFGTLAMAVILLLSLWSLNLPDDQRLYQSVLGLLVACAAPAAATLLRGRLLVAGLLAYALSNYAVAVGGLWLQAR